MFACGEDDLSEHARILARSHLGLIGGTWLTPTPLDRLARRLGIRIVSEPFLTDRSFAGAAIVTDDGLRLVIVNSLLVPTRWAFTVAHEIGHVALCHRGPRDAHRERLTNIYASELLMPLDRILWQMRAYSENPRYLAGLNGVSEAAMRIRLQEIAVTLSRLPSDGRCRTR